MHYYSFIINIGLAVLLGMCIGLERQWRQRSAGLRTNTLVAVGAAIFMVLASRIGGDAEGRIASYIVSGMGFLGAGVILKDGASIRGLNTAATLWCTAAVGALSGLGFYFEAIVGAVFIIGVNLVLRPISEKLRKNAILMLHENKDQEEYLYRFVINCRENVENHIRVLLVQYIGNNKDIMLQSLSSSDDATLSLTIIQANIISLSNQDNAMEKIASFLTLEKDVTSVKWMVEIH